MSNVQTKDFGSRAEWLAARQNTLGASDTPAIFGEGYSGSGPWTVWESKTRGTVDQETSELLHIGSTIEPTIRQLCRDLRGLVVEDPAPHQIHYNDRHPWLHATPDGFVTESGQRGGLECKNVGAWRQDWQDGPPLGVVIQVQHQMAVCEFPFCYVAGLVGGNKLVCRRIERDDEFIGMLVRFTSEWWDKYVVTNTPPPVDDLVATAKVLGRLHPDDNGETVEIDNHRLIDQLTIVKQDIAELQKKERKLKNEIKEALGDNTYGLFPDGQAVSWKTTERAEYTVRTTRFRKLRTHKSLPNQARIR